MLRRQSLYAQSSRLHVRAASVGGLFHLGRAAHRKFRDFTYFKFGVIDMRQHLPEVPRPQRRQHRRCRRVMTKEWNLSAGSLPWTRGPPRAPVVFDKSAAQLVGNIHGYVTGPAFGGIEGDDADRIFILPVEQVSDQRRAISSRFIGLTPCPTERAKIVQHYVNSLAPI
jgi:hypothetical protein